MQEQRPQGHVLEHGNQFSILLSSKRGDRMFWFRMRVFMLDYSNHLPASVNRCIIPLSFETLINSVTIFSTIIAKEIASFC